MQAEHRKRHTNALMLRPTANAEKQREAQEHALLNVYTQRSHCSFVSCPCSKQQQEQLCPPEDDEAKWRAVLGGTVALLERFRHPTNPCVRQT